MQNTPNNGTTPRSKIRTSNVLPSPRTHYPISQETPLRSTLLPKLMDFHDEYQDFEANIQNLQTVAQNLRNFNESFASFMYGFQINAYTVDFGKIPDSVNPEFIEHNEEVLSKIAELERELEDLERSQNKSTNNNHEGINNGNKNQEEPEEILSDEDLFEIQEPLNPPKSLQRRPLPKPRSTLLDNNTASGRRSFLPMRTNSTLSSQTSSEQRRSRNNPTDTPSSYTQIRSTISSSRRTRGSGVLGSASRVSSSSSGTRSASTGPSSTSSSRPSSSSRVLNHGRVRKNAPVSGRNNKGSSSLNDRPPFR